MGHGYMPCFVAAGGGAPVSSAGRCRGEAWSASSSCNAPPRPLSHGPPQQGRSGAWQLAAGQLLAAGALSLRQSRQRFSARSQQRPGGASRTALRAGIDQLGRRWETTVKVLRPSSQTPPGNSLQDRWRTGVGALRVVCHDVDSITTLDWQQETLCFGTNAGLVRTVDLESGSVVGDYYLGSHLPPAAITALRFDGSAIAVGDEHGRVHVWRAALPGSWGFAHSPDWVMSSPDCEDGALVHGAPVTALAIAAAGTTLVSCDAAGACVCWQRLGDSRAVAPAQQLELGEPGLGVPVLALCADGRDDRCLYAGLANGELVRVQLGEEGDVQQDRVHNFGEIGITALAWDSSTEALLLGLGDGSLQRWQPETGELQALAAFHEGEVQRISLPIPPAPGAAGPVGPPRAVTSDRTGRVGVWDLAALQPLWGLQGLTSGSVVALADRTRLVTTGLVINSTLASPQPHAQSWRDPPTPRAGAPPCEAVLCLDLLGSPQAAAAARERDRYWPTDLEKEPEKSAVRG